MKKRFVLFLLGCLLVLVSGFPLTFAIQKTEKPWTEWSKKEAEKVLSDSPWSQTQTDTDTSEMFFTPTSDPNLTRSTTNDRSRAEAGATNQAVNVKFVVRFFSARPVRRAHARLIELEQKPPPEVLEKLRGFGETKSADSIILTVTFESSDQRFARNAMQAFNSAVTATLKNETYLERDGKRLFLEEYVPPGKDGFGARFIFLRRVDEQPFLATNTGEVRFATKFPSGLKVDRKFKLEKMLLNGEFEY
jgi:hypothetical protein